MIKKTLATIDNSPRSQSVFDTSLSWAQATGAKLMLLHILSVEDVDYPILPTYAYYAVLKGKDDSIFDRKFDEYEQQEEKFLSNLTEKAMQRGLARQSVAERTSVEGTVEGGGFSHERLH